MKEIIVVGYPRSGNAWVARLIGEVLQCPVQGPPGHERLSCAYEGQDRTSEWRVIQTHVTPNSGGTFWLSGWQVDLDHADGRKIIHVVRDPRDVAVSSMYYWHLRSLKDTARKMLNGDWPLTDVPWHEFVMPWLNAWPSYQITTVRYIDLQEDPERFLRVTLERLGLSAEIELKDAISIQSFDTKRAELRACGDKYPYGRDLQLRHMRRGVPGEGVQLFTGELEKLVRDTWEPVMVRLGYKW